MSKVKINDMLQIEEVTAEMAEQVKGGPIYMKIEGVDGSVTESRSSTKIQEAVANGTF